MDRNKNKVKSGKKKKREMIKDNEERGIEIIIFNINY